MTLGANDNGDEFTREKQIAWIIGFQQRTLQNVAPLLAEIGQSRSKYADDAWACYSQVINACMAMHVLDQPKDGKLDG